MIDKILLFPYWLALKLRNRFYDKGWKKSAEAEVPTICVGNITAGERTCRYVFNAAIYLHAVAVYDCTMNTLCQFVCKVRFARCSWAGDNVCAFRIHHLDYTARFGNFKQGQNSDWNFRQMVL